MVWRGRVCHRRIPQRRQCSVNDTPAGVPASTARPKIDLKSVRACTTPHSRRSYYEWVLKVCVRAATVVPAAAGARAPEMPCHKIEAKYSMRHIIEKLCTHSLLPPPSDAIVDTLCVCNTFIVHCVQFVSVCRFCTPCRRVCALCKLHGHGEVQKYDKLMLLSYRQSHAASMPHTV